MNDITDHQTKAGEKAESLNRKSKDRLRGHRREASRRQYLALKADPLRYARHLNNVKRWRQAHPDYHRRWKTRHPEQYAARKGYISAWKAAHPERQREYERRWKLKQGITVGGRKCLTHEESIQKMREIPQPFSSKQFALHVGITHRGACNLFKTLTAAGKIQVVRNQRWARLYEVCSSVPAIPTAEMVAGGAR
jgi:hypothetical protein